MTASLRDPCLRSCAGQQNHEYRSPANRANCLNRATAGLDDLFVMVDADKNLLFVTTLKCVNK
jgi:hypothetical protein